MEGLLIIIPAEYYKIDTATRKDEQKIDIDKECLMFNRICIN